MVKNVLQEDDLNIVHHCPRHISFKIFNKANLIWIRS